MIGLFNDCFPPIMDGVSVAVSNYARWLNEKGRKACVVTTTSSFSQDGGEAFGYPVYRYFSMPILMRKPYRLGLPRLDFNCNRQLASVDFELLHAHCPFSSGQLAMRIAKARHLPLIATFHSKYRADFERAMPNKCLVDYMVKRIVRFYERADEVWLPQASVEPTLREYGYRGKVEIVDNGNDFSGLFTAEERLNARKELGIGEGTFLFIFVGQHIWEKNLAFLMKSLALLSEVNYKMMFVGTGYAAGDLRRMAAELGLADRVVFKGCITDRGQLRSVYAAADLFLFPSLYDNAPLVVREAAAMHTPSVLIKGSTASSVITDGENGFLSENTVQGFASTVRRICNDADLPGRVGVGASATLARSWEDIMGEVAERYDSLIKRYRK